MTRKIEKLNNAYTPLPEGQNPTAQTKRTDFASTETPNLQTNELTQKEILRRIKDKCQELEGNLNYKSLHR